MKIYVSGSPALIPIIKIIHKSMPDAKFYAGHPDMARQLVDLDLPAVAMGSDLTADVRPLTYKHAARIVTQMTVAQISPVEGIHSVVIDYLNREIPSFLYPRISDLIGYALAMDATKPDICIIHNDVEPLMNLVAQWCIAHSVPCLHVPHAVYLDGFDRGEPGTDIHDIVTADHIVTAGPYQDAWYKTRGGNTHLLGLPQFDKWAMFHMERKQARSLMGLNPTKQTVTFASSWRQDTNLLGCHDGLGESYVAFLQAMQLMPDVQPIIKLHPHANNGEWHVKLAREYNVACAILAQHGEVVLAASDALVSYGPSNYVLEAACVPNLRLLSIGGFKDDEVVDTLEANPDEIKAALTNTLSKPARNTATFVGKYLGTVDGLAATRIAQCAEELCQLR